MSINLECELTVTKTFHGSDYHLALLLLRQFFPVVFLLPVSTKYDHDSDSILL